LNCRSFGSIYRPCITD